MMPTELKEDKWTFLKQLVNFKRRWAQKTTGSNEGTDKNWLHEKKLIDLFFISEETEFGAKYYKSLIQLISDEVWPLDSLQWDVLVGDADGRFSFLQFQDPYYNWWYYQTRSVTVRKAYQRTYLNKWYTPLTCQRTYLNGTIIDR